jgi:Flp pilus assembly pilin Flp
MSDPGGLSIEPYRPGPSFHPALAMSARGETSCLRALGWWFGDSSAQLGRRLAVETDGQDLIEYALLTAFIGFAGAAAWVVMQTGLGNAYSGFNDAVWDLWAPDDPVGVGS